MSEQQILSELSVDNIRAHVQAHRRDDAVATRRHAQCGAHGRVQRRADQGRRGSGAHRDDPRAGQLPARGRADDPVARAEGTAGEHVRSQRRDTAGRPVRRTRLCRFGTFFRLRGQGRSRKDHALRAVLFARAVTRSSASPGIMGSTAQIMRNWGYPEKTALPLGSVKPAWGNPTPETIKTEMPAMPCIGISRSRRRHICSICSPRDRCACGCTPMSRTAGAICR